MKKLSFGSVVALAFAIGCAACADDTPPLVQETVSITDTDDPAGPYHLSAVARDAGGISGAWIFFSVDGKQSFESTSMWSVGPEAFTGAIRGLPIGTRVDYYLAARDNAANVGTDPAAAPANTYCFLVGSMPSHPRVLVVSPGRGPTTGGTRLSIYGQDFRPGARVFVNGVEAADATIVDPTLATAVAPAGSAGFVDVTVENPGAGGADDGPCRRLGDRTPVRATLPRSFLYVAPPAPSAVEPPSGPTAGGTTVVVVGTDFVDGATVTFDGVPGVGCVFVSSTALQCVTPPGDPGPANVVVTNPDGYVGTLADGYRYVPPPELFAIDPVRGPDAGGTAVQVSGRGFDAGAILLFDNLQQDSGVVVDASTLRGKTLPHAVGYVTVSVRNSDGQESSLPRGFFYYGPPIIDGINPPLGPTSGGQRVTLSGSSFVPGLTVTFDGLAATIVSVTEVEVIVLTPPHPEATVVVTVTNPDRRFASTRYRYVPAPEISTLAPNCGPASGGTEVTVTGLNFQTGATLLFAETPAASATVSSPAVLRATTPVRPGGAVDVRVRNPDGALSTNTGRFEFVAAPRIDSVAPTNMLLCGGLPVTVRGAEFLAGATVTIGGQACADVQVVSATELRCTPPALPAGTQPIVVTNHACINQSSTGGATLAYQRLRFSPTGGLTAGFTNTKILFPAGLQKPVAAVRFGAQAALDLQVRGGVTFAQSPPQQVGEVPLEVTLQGCAPELAEGNFAYRVLVDQTSERLPVVACSGTPTECHGAAFRFGDLNGDGLQDFVQVNGGVEPSDTQNNVVFLNRPDRPGFFAARALPDGPSGTMNHASVDLGDVDQNGTLDVLVAGSRGGVLYTNDGRANFSVAGFTSTLSRLGGSFDAKFADLNRDGFLDIVYLEIGNAAGVGEPARNGPDHVFLGGRGGVFNERQAAFPETFSVHDHRMGIADFNGDGNLDVAIVVDSHYTPQPPHRLLLGNGDGTLRMSNAPSLSGIFGDIFGIQAGDFNGDGRPDLFLAVEGAVIGQGGCGLRIVGQRNVLLLTDSSGSLVDRSDLLPADADPSIGVAAYDIDGDGDLDLVVVNYGRDSKIYVNEGNGRFHDASASFTVPPTCGQAAAVSPIDNTGIPAVVIGGSFSTRLWVQTAAP